MNMLKKVVTNSIDWFLYSVLSEKQKERITNMFSEKQKASIKKLTKHGKKSAQKNEVKHLKDHLYALGFTTEALAALEEVYETTNDRYLKRLVAWELTLWHTNQYTKAGAEAALRYMNEASHGEKDTNQLRRIAIIKAECLARLEDYKQGQEVLHNILQEAPHPDIYLALANLETDIQKRFLWVNKVYAHYDLNPITFSHFNQPTYDDLIMEKTATPYEAPEKISVILPAYNAEDGIQIAIESILSQTWQNLELLIVDDCSPDNTYNVAKRYEAKDSRVRVLQTPENSGPYIARNIGLKYATGDFVTINDADDWSHEKKLEIQARHLLENDAVIANTSAHSRLTEDLFLYRRGTPGKYIFPNMSSILFRRTIVMEKLGYWDSVRFAADGEFKRRLIRTFGKRSYVDLDSGPLSLPRQSVASLTSSSAFGYNGFFMGVRKEFVESLENYHATADSLYYPYPMTERPYPVPEPMWPKREEKLDGKRHFDYIIAADFRHIKSEFDDLYKFTDYIRKQTQGKRIGLVQLYAYDLHLPIHVSPYIRQLIDGNQVQMLVYGEHIQANQLYVYDCKPLANRQKYVPEITADQVHILATDNINEIDMEKVDEQVIALWSEDRIYIPLCDVAKAQLESAFSTNTKIISPEKWVLADEQ